MLIKCVILILKIGIGKTTSAVLCCKELGLDYIEMNASDVRNKLGMSKHSGQLQSYQIEKFFTNKKKC